MCAQSDAGRVFGRQRQRLIVRRRCAGICVPPSTAARAWIATRAILFFGCWAVSDTPAVCVWKRIHVERRCLRAKSLGHQPIPDLARGAELGDLLKEVVMGIEEEAQPGSEIVDAQPAAQRPLHVLHAVIEGESELLQRRRTCLANVIAADRDGVEARSKTRAELKGVDHQAHGRRGRKNIFLLRDVFLEDVVLQRAGAFAPVPTLLARATTRYIAQSTCSPGELMVIETVVCSRLIPEKSVSISSSESMATPHLPTSPSLSAIVGIAAHQRRQVKGNREPALRRLPADICSAAFVSSGLAKPENWRIVQSLPRYPLG